MSSISIPIQLDPSRESESRFEFDPILKLRHLLQSIRRRQQFAEGKAIAEGNVEEASLSDLLDSADETSNGSHPAIEFQLLRLSLITGIAPRSNQSMINQPQESMELDEKESNAIGDGKMKDSISNENGNKTVDGCSFASEPTGNSTSETVAVAASIAMSICLDDTKPQEEVADPNTMNTSIGSSTISSSPPSPSPSPSPSSPMITPTHSSSPSPSPSPSSSAITPTPSATASCNLISNSNSSSSSFSDASCSSSSSSSAAASGSAASPAPASSDSNPSSSDVDVIESQQLAFANADDADLNIPDFDSDFPEDNEEVEDDDAVWMNEPAAGSSATYWAPGTGYGYGSNQGQIWDVDAYLSAQKKKDEEIIEIARNIENELKAEKVNPSLFPLLDQSNLVPFLCHYLANDSITEMERSADLYHLIFDIVLQISRHESIVPLFNRLPGEKKSVLELIRDLNQKATMIEKFTKIGSSETLSTPAIESSASNATTATATECVSSLTSGASSQSQSVSVASDSTSISAPLPIESAGGPMSITAHILQMAAAADAAVARHATSAESEATGATGETEPELPKKRIKLGNEMKLNDISTSSVSVATTASLTDSDAEKSEALMSHYVPLLEDCKFAEVSNFQSHHYLKDSTYNDSSMMLNRVGMRRIAVEFSDLSKSLPVDRDSAVWYRVHESKMQFGQFLIAAPNETPYGHGLFLFDVFFPQTYPSTPPLVNLQTTGHGTVRFNPNLYNCGKVCLSLLGTWAGSAGEGWDPKSSTFLQVAVSIQSLIFVPQPYFNEPSYERAMGTASGQAASKRYNDRIQVATIEFAMIGMMRSPPPGFEEIVRIHFSSQKYRIMKQCRQWAETNSKVKPLLPQLEAAFNELALAGSETGGGKEEKQSENVDSTLAPSSDSSSSS